MQKSASNLSQYNSVAKEYNTTEFLPYRIYAEFPTFENLLGNLADKSVLDVACGTGVITELIASFSPMKIVGLDINEHMLSLARNRLSSYSYAQFIHADICNYNFSRKYDIAVSAFGLNEMRNLKELHTFINSISMCLNSGGKLCLEFDNALSCINYDWTQYGISHYQLFSDRESVIDYQFTLKVDKSVITLKCTYFTEQQILSVIEAAGLIDIEFHSLQISPLGFQSMSSNYWNQFSECSLMRFVTAYKV